MFVIPRPPRNYKRIIEYASAQNNDVTIYTVPTGKKFMLLSIFYEDNGAVITSILWIDTTLVLDNTFQIQRNISLVFPYPIILEGGERLHLQSIGVANNATCKIIGYEFSDSDNVSFTT